MNRKIALYLRILLDGRRVFAKPANTSGKSWNGFGAMKQAHAVVGGRCERHDEGAYYRRYQIAGRRVWEPGGSVCPVLHRLNHRVCGGCGSAFLSILQTPRRPSRRTVPSAPFCDTGLRGPGGEQSLCFIPSRTRDSERLLVRHDCVPDRPQTATRSRSQVSDSGFGFRSIPFFSARPSSMPMPAVWRSRAYGNSR
jgi:hypothetical protein